MSAAGRDQAHAGEQAVAPEPAAAEAALGGPEATPSARSGGSAVARLTPAAVLQLQRSAGNAATTAAIARRASLLRNGKGATATPPAEAPDKALELVPQTLERYQQAIDATDEGLVRAVGREVASVWERVELAKLGQAQGQTAPSEQYDRARQATLQALPTQRFKGADVAGPAAAPKFDGAIADYVTDQVGQTAWVVKDAAAAARALQAEDPLSEPSAWNVVGLLRQHPNPWNFAFMLAVIRDAGMEERLGRLPPSPADALGMLRTNQDALRKLGLGPGDPVGKIALAPEANTVSLVQPLTPVEVAAELYGSAASWRDVLLPLNRTALGSASDGGWLKAGTTLIVQPDNLQPAYRLIFMAAAAARHKQEQTGNRPVLHAKPEGPIVPGNHVSISVSWPNAAFGDTPIEWSAVNDPSAVAEGKVEERLVGPKGSMSWGGTNTNTSWEIKAGAVGNHVVHCKVTPSDGEVIDVAHTIVVMTADERMGLQQAANAGWDKPAPDLLADLKKKRDTTSSATEKAELQKRIDGLEGILKDTSVQMRPLQGSYVSTDSQAASIGLRIYADLDRSGSSTDSVVRLKLWDLTLNGLPRHYTASGATANEALRKLIEEFADDAPYPDGKIRVAIPAGALGLADATAQSVDAETDGGMLIDDVLRGASLVALGVGVVAAGLAQPEVAIPAFIVSSLLAGSAAAFEIADRLEHGDFEWDLQTAMNLLDIAAALLTLGMAGGGTAAVRGVGRLRLIGQVNKGVGLTQIAVQAGVHLAAITAAVKSGDMQQIVTALGQALAAGALFLIVHKASAKLGGNVDEALGKAAGTRTGSGTVDPEGLAKLMNSLPEVPVDERALRAFAAESVGLAADGVKLAPVGGGTVGEGVSGSPVWLVKNAEGEVVAALKLFVSPEEFARELSSLQKLSTLQLSEGKGVAAKGVGRTSTNGKPGGVLVSSAAEGQAVNRMMAKAAQATGPARDKALAELKDAVGANARALSKLHSQGPPGEVANSYIDRHVKACEEISTKLEAHRDPLAKVGFDTAAVRPKVDELGTAFREHPGGSSIVHGDAHPGNFFYDPATGITMIDTPTMHYSLDAQGNPIGSAGRDVANFGQKLAHFGEHFGLRPDEIADLQRIFASNYKEAGGGPSTPESDAFFRARTALGELIKTANETNVSEDALRHQADLAREALGLAAKAPQ